MSEQIEREYREALDSFRFSSEEKGRMMKSLMERQEAKPEKRRGFRPLRTGLIAACLCLSLVGTAFAAATVYSLMVKTYDRWMYHDEELARFEVYGEVDFHSLEDFSQQLQNDYNDWLLGQYNTLPRSRSFDNWEDAKAYIGDGIPCTWRDTSGTVWEGAYRVQAVPDLSKTTTGLQHVEFYSGFRLPGGQSAGIVIYAYGKGHPYEELYGMAAPLGADIRVLEDYPMANGCTARVVSRVDPPDSEGEYSPSYCIGFFTKGGMLYQVSMPGGNLGQISMVEMEARLHEVLDTFY